MIGFSRLRGTVKRKRYDDAAIKVAALRKAGKAHDDAAAAVLSHEAEKVILDGITEGTVSSRLGDLLKAKKINVSDLKNKWNDDGNGKLDLAELTHHVSELGFEATEEEYAQLFAELDKDNSKSLASKELVQALTRLQADSKSKQERQEKQTSVVAHARKVSEQMQLKAKALKMVRAKGMFE